MTVPDRDRPSMQPRTQHWLLRPFLIAFGVGVVVFGATYLIAPTYQSDLSLYFPQDQQSGGLSGLSALARGKAGAEGGVVSTFGGALASPLVGSGPNMAIAILTSRTLLDRIVTQLDLAHKWDMKESAARDKLRGDLITEIDRNGLWKVSVTDHDRELSRQILNALVGELNIRSGELSINVSRRNRIYVEQRLKLADAEIAKTKAFVGGVLTDFTTGDLQSTTQAYFTAKAALDKQKIEESSDEARLNSLVSSYKRLYRPGADAAADTLALTSSNQSFVELSREMQRRRLLLDDAMATFAKGSPEFKAAVEQWKTAEAFASRTLKKSEATVADGANPVIANALSQFQSSRQSVEAASKILDTYRVELRRSPQLFVEAEAAKSRLSTALAQRAELSQELELAKIAESRDPSRFEMVDSASIEDKPIGPRRTIISGAIALAVFLLFAFRPMQDRYFPAEPH